MDNPEPVKKKFAALCRPMGKKDEAYITRVILAENQQAAEHWFGEHNFEVHGTVYRSGK